MMKFSKNAVPELWIQYTDITPKLPHACIHPTEETKWSEPGEKIIDFFLWIIFTAFSEEFASYEAFSQVCE